MTNNLEPSKIITIIQTLLMELERTLSAAPQQVNETADARALQLRGQIDRLDSVLKKRQAATQRRKELERENEKNNGR